MYIPDGTEILYRIEDVNGVHQIAMDEETLAHCLNNGVKVIEEIMVIHRREDEESVFYPLIPGGETNGVVLEEGGKQ